MIDEKISERFNMVQALMKVLQENLNVLGGLMIEAEKEEENPIEPE